MFDKEKDLAQAFLNGKISRRELIKRFGALGLTASSCATTWRLR